MLSSLPIAIPPLLLHTSLLLFPFSSTHYHYCFPCPPTTVGPAPLLLHPLPLPLPITSSNALPSLFSHYHSLCTSYLHRHFASTSHPIATPPAFPFPFPPRPKVSPVLHPPPVPPLFSSTCNHFPSPLPHPLLLSPLLSHCCSPCTSHLYCHFAFTSYPIATPPAFRFSLPLIPEVVPVLHHHRSRSPSPPPATTLSPHYLFHCCSSLSSPIATAPSPSLPLLLLPLPISLPSLFLSSSPP